MGHMDLVRFKSKGLLIMVPEQNHYDKIINFVGELQYYQNDFPRHVLTLLSKYFKDSKLTFFPGFDSQMRKIRDRNPAGTFSTDFIGMGLYQEVTSSYVDHYYKFDIFQPPNLPPELLNKSVISIEDVMPYSEFKDTEYYRFLAAGGIYYQMCMFLDLDGERYGCIGMFRTEEMGDFSPQDRWTAEKIAPYIAQAYKQSVDISRIQARLDVHRQFLEHFPFGMLMLNVALEVIEQNDIFTEICMDIREGNNSTPAANNTFQASKSPVNAHEQFVLNHIRMQLTNCSDKTFGFQMQGKKQGYQFSVTPYIAADATGRLQTYYSVYITMHPLKQIQQTDYSKYGLTKRETEVFSLIAIGHTNRQIAEELVISEHTVKAHIMNLFSKTGVCNRTELIHILQDR